jgi:hypothetical protein
MANPSDTLGSPWIPHEILSCSPTSCLLSANSYAKHFSVPNLEATPYMTFIKSQDIFHADRLGLEVPRVAASGGGSERSSFLGVRERGKRSERNWGDRCGAERFSCGFLELVNHCNGGRGLR